MDPNPIYWNDYIDFEAETYHCLTGHLVNMSHNLDHSRWSPHSTIKNLS
jgi:hypothetical protein